MKFATKRTEGVQQWNKKMQRPTADFKSNTTRIQKQKKSLSMAWIDYQKALNRVPHSWIIKSLELTRI